jgi:LacI family transcriptional regulator
MKNKKEVTIYDIAKKLDISITTVSRGLQDHPAINKNTRKKIKEAAAELGYRHNLVASNLRKQKTNTIGVIVHELNSSFITSVLSGIEKVLTKEGYSLIITNSYESFEKEAANASSLFNKRVDGLIASLAFDTNGLEHYQQFKDKGIPIIFFDRVDEDAAFTKVIIDNYKAAYQATQHLIDQKCSRIVTITASLNRNVYANRLKGYKHALLDNNLPFNNDYVIIKDLSEQGCIEATLAVIGMNPLPDGIFLTSDFSAAVCMKTLKENGIRVPEDIAIVGFNNDAVSRIVEPVLTTVNYPGIEVGEITATNLINHLKGIQNIDNANTIMVRSELIIRKSSVRIRN